MFFGKIKSNTGADRTFGLQNDLVTQGRSQSLAKKLFALSFCIDICMIEEIEVRNRTLLDSIFETTQD